MLLILLAKTWRLAASHIFAKALRELHRSAHCRKISQQYRAEPAPTFGWMGSQDRKTATSRFGTPSRAAST